MWNDTTSSLTPLSNYFGKNLQTAEGKQTHYFTSNKGSGSSPISHVTIYEPPQPSMPNTIEPKLILAGDNPGGKEELGARIA